MDEEIITFGNIEIEKYNSFIFLEDVNTDNILVSNKISSYWKNISTLLITCMMIIKLNH